MIDARFQKQIDRWLTDEYGRIRRLYRAAAALYYNKVPRDFRPTGIMHWTMRTGLASSAPAVAYYYGSITGWTASVVGTVLFVAHSTVSLLDRLSMSRKSNGNGGQSDLVVRICDLLSNVKGKAKTPSDRDNAIRACLGILENYCRTVTRTSKGEVSVSLVLFSGSSQTRMSVRHRNPGNERPTGRHFDAEALGLLGYHACIHGPLPRVVHDLKSFGKHALVSPTQSKVDYRSILIVPVCRRTDGTATIRGFVSIDCTRPYAFYGNRANVIMVTCEPVFSHINDLI